MRLFRVVGRVFVLSVQRELAHRANLLLGVLMSVVEIAAGIATLAVLFTHVEVLAGEWLR